MTISIQASSIKIIVKLDYVYIFFVIFTLCSTFENNELQIGYELVIENPDKHNQVHIILDLENRNHIHSSLSKKSLHIGINPST